jgi:formylglycine-generating enzyme required for sulfatase activity/beta-lactamase regulating signal transducer with metallopeptidase domain/ABC-type glycerol-3-phosphate transport system substrate-binding protein
MNIITGDAIQQFLGDSVLLERLFWATIELTVLAAAVWVGIRLFRKLSPRVRALLWLLVLVKPLFALCVGAAMPIFEVDVLQPPLTTVQESTMSPLPKITTVHETEPAATTPTASATSTNPGSGMTSSTTATAPVKTIPATRPEAPARQLKITWPGFPVLFAYAWIAIALLLGLYKGLDVIRLRRLIRTSNVPSTALKERYEAIASQIGVKHPPRLCITETLETPALAGVFRPVILLPQWMLKDKYEAAVGWALRHELIHWKHGDTLANLLRQITEVLFFFHPLAWFAGKRWEEEAELACDRALINTTDEANEYAHSLYEVLDQLHGRRQRALATGLFATRTQVGRRITALLTNPLRHSAKINLSVMFVLVLIAAFTLPVGGVFSAKEDMRAIDGITVDENDAPVEGKPIEELTLTLPGDVPLVLVRIPAGTFMMGRYAGERDSYATEDPQHLVTLSQDFYMGKYEVTQQQWLAVMGSWPGETPLPTFGMGNKYPAYWVSWDDAQNFITALNTYIINTNQGPATVRLPSEAEWEYACRGGTTTRFYFGDSLGCAATHCSDCAAGVLTGNCSDYMWYCGNNRGGYWPEDSKLGNFFGLYDMSGKVLYYGNSRANAKPVGGKLANAFGLYDMSGNVWEWCEDDWHDNYTGAPSNGSAWVDVPRGKNRLLRGGYWGSLAVDCRAANRCTYPDSRLYDRGFRVACAAAETAQDNAQGVTIEIGSLSTPSSFVPWLETEIASFRNSHPDIEVRTHLLREPQRLERPLYEYPPLAKNVIGIDSMPGFETAFLVNNGLLVPIDQFLPDPDFDIKDFPENYFDSVTYQGKIWGIPWFTTNDVLLCDMSVLNAAGIQDPPATWDDVLQCIEKVVRMERTDTITNPVGLRVDTSNDTAPGILMSYILQKDGYVLRDGRFDLSHPAVEEGLIFLHQLAFNTEGVVIDRRSVRAALEDSTVQYAMQVVPVNQLEPVIDMKRLRIAPLPTAGKEVTACEMRLYFAVRKASEAEEKASWEFIKWMSRPDVSLPPLWKGFPCRKDIVQRPEFIAMTANGIQNFEVAVTSAWRGIDVGDQVINRSKGFDALWSGLVPVLVAGTELSSVADVTTQMANDAISTPVETEPQRFVIQATDLSIQGRIYDVDTGKGIAGVLVRVFPGKGGANLRPTSLTKSDGIYELSPLSTGEYSVVLEAVSEYPVPGFDNLRKLVVLSKDNTASGIDFALKRGTPIHGIVKNQDGTPASGASVGAAISTTPHIFRVESGVDGQFVVYIPSSDTTVSLQSRSDAFESKLLSDQNIPAEGLEAIQLILDQPRTGSISGVIVDTDGKPMAELNVAAWNMTSSVYTLENPTKTTPKGLFVCENLAAGEYAIIVTPSDAPGFSKSDEYARAEIGTGEQIKDIEIVFDGLSKGVIAGTVHNAQGQPVGGAMISADYRGNATSSEAGAFRLEHFSPKECQLEARHPDYAIARLSVAAGTHDVSIVLPNKPVLQGHVVEAGSRKPLSHFMIGCRAGALAQLDYGLYVSGKHVESTDGFFRMETIQDAGEYTVIAWIDGFTYTLRTVTIEPGTTTDLKLALEPIAPVNGTVVDEQGASVNDACIYFIALPNLSVLEQVTVARSDNNGHFSLSSPPRELAWLAAYKPGYAIGVARNSDNWRIVLPQPAVVEGVVHGEDINLEMATVSIERQQEELPGYWLPIDDAGAFRIPDILPGAISIKVQVKNPSQYIKHTMQVEAGATKHVEFTFESGTGTVEGIVTKPENPTRMYGLSLERIRDGYSDVMTTSLRNDGHYKFENVWSGALILRLEYLDAGDSKKGMQSASEISFTLKPGENKYQDFAL